MNIESSSSSSSVDATGDENVQDACCICLEEFDSLHPSSITKCKHEYHSHCIERWSKIRKDCPICSRPLVILIKVGYPEANSSATKSTRRKKYWWRLPYIIRTPGSDVCRIMYYIGKNNNDGMKVFKSAYVYRENTTAINFPAPNYWDGHLRFYDAAVYWNDYANSEKLVTPDFFVAMKVIKCNERDVVFQNLKAAVARNCLVPYHPNLIGVKSDFMIYYRDYCFVIFALTDSGSIRSVMMNNNQFSHGLPEPLIVIVLRETLKGLSLIHEKGFVHGDINAGHIFYNERPEAKIRLAFEASIYDQDEDIQDDQTSLPMISICDWAASPQVYGNDYISYTQKDDIWQFGITALELAYGRGLQVSNREELDMKLLNIQKTKEIPFYWRNRENETKKHSTFDLMASFLFRKKIFSKSFQKMVVSCLCIDPASRPTVPELLSNEVFTRSNTDVKYFRRRLRKNN